MNRNLNANLKMSRLLDFYGNLLSGRSYEICCMYFNDDLSLAEIAEEVGITRQGVREAVKKGEAQLNMFEEKLGLLKKFEEMQSDVQKILELVKRKEPLFVEETEQIDEIAQRILS